MAQVAKHQETTAMEFFGQDTPHGLVKRFMYKRYLQAYVPMTQNPGLKTIIVDGFAGAGRYGDGWPDEIECYGSPVIALRVCIQFSIKKSHILHKKNPEEFQELTNSFEPFSLMHDSIPEEFPPEKERYVIHLPDIQSRITLIFVEKHRRVFRELLRNVMATFKFYRIPVKITTRDRIRIHEIYPENQDDFSIRCVLINSSFDRIKPPEVGPKERCLTFLDPYGISHTPMNTVLRFAGQYQEVLINFMSSYVSRFVSIYPEHIADLFGISTPQGAAVSEYVQNVVFEDLDHNDRDRLDRCVRNYEVALQNAVGTEFALTFEMRGIYNSRIYHLIFITHHIRGLKQMKEAMTCATQEEREFLLSDFRILRRGIPLSLANKQDKYKVAEVIYEHFKGKANVSIKEVERYVLLNTPFVFRTKPLGILEENKKIVDVKGFWNEHEQVRKKHTYPDWTEWFLSFSDELAE